MSFKPTAKNGRPKHARSLTSQAKAFEPGQLEAAELVLSNPDRYGAGLEWWAKTYVERHRPAGPGPLFGGHE